MHVNNKEGDMGSKGGPGNLNGVVTVETIKDKEKSHGHGSITGIYHLHT
jgi:hypothetical protein